MCTSANGTANEPASSPRPFAKHAQGQGALVAYSRPRASHRTWPHHFPHLPFRFTTNVPPCLIGHIAIQGISIHLRYTTEVHHQPPPTIHKCRRLSPQPKACPSHPPTLSPTHQDPASPASTAAPANPSCASHFSLSCLVTRCSSCLVPP